MKPQPLSIAKLLLVAIIFISFGTVFSVTAYLAENRPVINPEPQVSPAPTPTVALNPTPTPTVKDETSDWKIYTNDKYGFEFKYPSNLKPETEFEGGYLFGDNLCSIDDISDNPNGTPIINIPLYELHTADYFNFIMELRIGINSKPEEVADCLKFDCSDYGGNCFSKENINGIDFTILPIEDAGLSNYLHGKSYRTVYKNSCFALEQINYGTPGGGDIDPSIVQDYRNKGTDTINEILSTFKFTK